MVSYINETDFVIENKKLVYPEIVTDGLQLYYDAKGKRDTDYHRDTMLDMSGNKNHGKLHNFAYEKHSGYKDGLVFDYIDDKLVRPKLNLKPDDFTFMLNGNIISFSPDGTVKRVQDGEVTESKGFNLIRNGDFADKYITRWNGTGVSSIIDGIYRVKRTGTGIRTSIIQSLPVPFEKGRRVYIEATFSVNSSDATLLQFNIRGTTNNGTVLYKTINNPIKDKVYTVSEVFTIIDDGNLGNSILYVESGYSASTPNYGQAMDVYKVQAIDLTETFGAGKEPTKEQMDEIINRFGFVPNAQDLIDRVEYKGNDLGDMENIIDGLYKTEVLSGEEIYTDKADDAVVHVEVDGKSYQHAGSGKNLLSVKTYKGRIDHNTGNETLSEGSSRIISGFIKVNPNTRYTLSREYEVSNTDIGYYLYNENKEYIRGIYGYKDYNSLTFPTSEGVEYVKVSYSINDTFVQLEEGSTATEYEPPAPTPDYPIEIHSLNDFDVVSSVGKENLLKGKSAPITLSAGANTTHAYHTTTYDWEVGETYTFSADIDIVKNATGFSGVSLYPYNGGSGGPTGYGATMTPIVDGRVSMTFVANENLRHFLIYAGQAGRTNNNTIVISNRKLEKTSRLTPYSPAPEDIVEGDNHSLIDKINLLLDEPLRSVGDVKDRLFRDSDGLWKVERRIRKKVFSGSEIWNLEQRHVNDEMVQMYTRTGIINMRLGGPGKAISNRFVDIKQEATLDGNKKTGMYSNTSYTNVLRFKVSPDIIGSSMQNTNSEIVSAWNTWLSENETYVIYELETPTIETLSQTLQDRLNNLRSFEDSNYVYTTLPNEDNYLSENLKPTLHAKFLYNNWYKEDRVINNLMIYNRALTNEEMLQNYKTIKRRWGM